MSRTLICLGVLMLTALGPAAAPAAAASLMLSAAEQERLGVAASPLAARTEALRTPAIVRVVDLAPLAQLDADLAAATASASASQREAERTARLAGQDRSASAQAVEAAQAQAAADAARVSQLSNALQLAWGSAIAQMTPEERADLIAAAASGDAALLRADAPEYPNGVIGSVAVEAGEAPFTAEPLGLAGGVDPRMQTLGLISVVRGPAAAALRPGRVLSGAIETSERVSGVLMPRSAVVRLDGADWAYVRADSETFERREIVDPTPLADGWLLMTGFAAGDAVVDQNAGSLVALERADESAETD